MPDRMRIGCVPYGHAKPFAAAWAEKPPDWDHPKGLAGKLWGGELDLALVPVWEVLTRPGSRVLDGIAIGSRGPVRSVGVFHDLPLEQCRSIRLTPHSVTSVQLWKLVAAQRGLTLKEHNEGNARLFIGDEALAEWNRRNGAGVLDLGQAWTEWTGKPFVFGVWALGPKADIPMAALDRFREACRQGIAQRASLALDEREKEYLTGCIRYELGTQEKAGLDEFGSRSGLQPMKIRWV
jgi:chorismate dehydratase